MAANTTLFWLMVTIALTILSVVTLGVMLIPRYLASWGRQIKLTTEQSMADFLIYLPARQLWSRAAMLVAPIALLVAIAISVGAMLIMVTTLLLVLPWLKKLLLKLRHKAISKQLPDFIGQLANACAAGLGLSRAFEVTAAQVPIPLRYEIQLVVRRNRTGDSLHDALQGFHDRVPIPAVMYFVFTVQLGLKHGSQQVETLKRLALSIQQQIYARERLLSLSAQARMQGKVMLALPVLLFFLLKHIQPSNVELLLRTTAGNLMLFGCAILLTVGHLLIRQIMGDPHVR